MEIIPQLISEGVICDAIVTDPPYHLLPTVKRFARTKIGGSTDVEQRAENRGDGLGRLASGFMGQAWDGGDIAFRPETWGTIANILRPGAFLLAFGGTRTYHHLACAIEDGGFVIQDCIMWLFATGFPKRRDMLKPAYEPIVLAYKPDGKRTMQIDECRIGDETITTKAKTHFESPLSNIGRTGFSNGCDESVHIGRWPANVCHDGSDEVLEVFGVDDHPGARPISEKVTSNPIVNVMNKGWPRVPYPGRNDTGSAARFFFSAKAGAQDRWGSRHPTVKPVELMKWLVPLVCPPRGLVLDPFSGSGTTGIAAFATGRNAILIEQDNSYISDIRERLAHYEGDGKHSLVSKSRNSVDTTGTLL